MTLLAVALALVGSLFFALGAALQQFEAVGTGEEKPKMRALLRKPRWLLGTVSIGGGAGLQVVALDYGPLTVVQPVGVASLLFALPIAATLHKRRPERRELAAAAVVAAGLVGLVLMVPSAEGPARLDLPGVVLLLAITGAIAVFAILAAKTVPPTARAALYAVSAGAMYGATAVLMRVLVDDGWSQWYLYVPGVLVTALPGVVLLQRAYAAGHFGVSFASLQVTDPFTAVVFGALLLGEPMPTGVVPVLAAAITVVGTFALARTSPLERTT
ncbi:DMT family transporter [Nonomuraea longicatena]|uniref:DMT family transporter n=1 Tax=Nonomuraea longicatena TaxID=83682 RepID=A0ABP4BM88_9ACTN